MNARNLLASALVLFWAALLALPSTVAADRGPIRELGADVVFEDIRSDPEVPDAGEPRGAFRTGNENGSYEDARIENEKRSRENARIENWLRRILRVLRAMALGGLVR